MKRKHLLLALIAALGIGTSTAQVTVGTSFLNPGGNMNAKEFPTLKEKKTVFVADQFETEDIEDLLKEVWKVNSYEVISREDYNKDKNKFIKEEYAIFELNGFIKTGRNGSTIFIYLEYFTPIHIKQKSDKLKYDKAEIASIFFGGKNDAMWKMIQNKAFGDLQGDLYNYQLGYLKNYLQFINSRVEQKAIWFVPGHIQDEKTKVLKNATLLIPDYIKSGAGGKDDVIEKPDELFEKYPFKYEWMSNVELNNKILKGGTEDFYYLGYTQMNGNKMIVVTNGRTGEIIYKDSVTMSRDIKSKDLKELASAIGKK